MNNSALTKISVVKLAAFTYTRYPAEEPQVKLINESSKYQSENPLINPELTLCSEIVEVQLTHVPTETFNGLRRLKLIILREKATENCRNELNNIATELSKLEQLTHDSSADTLPNDNDIPF